MKQDWHIVQEILISSIEKKQFKEVKIEELVTRGEIFK